MSPSPWHLTGGTPQLPQCPGVTLPSPGGESLVGTFMALATQYPETGMIFRNSSPE